MLHLLLCILCGLGIVSILLQGKEETELLIKLRMSYECLFTGKRNGMPQSWPGSEFVCNLLCHCIWMYFSSYSGMPTFDVRLAWDSANFWLCKKCVFTFLIVYETIPYKICKEGNIRMRKGSDVRLALNPWQLAAQLITSDSRDLLLCCGANFICGRLYCSAGGKGGRRQRNNNFSFNWKTTADQSLCAWVERQCNNINSPPRPCVS